VNAPQHTSPAGTALVGVRAILITPELRSRHGVPPVMAPGPVSAPDPEPAGPHPSEGMPPARTTVLGADVESGLRARWSRLRGAFADDPRGGVQDADGLLQDISAAFTGAIEEHRARLAAGWQVGRPGVDRLQDALRQYDGLVGVLLRQP
jgi:hypothetical protein